MTIDVPLPSNLPAIATAKLPETYSKAREALEKCDRIDECADWANKAEALASYAKQADDRALWKMAVRIQARAIRRCGELLKEIVPAKGGRPFHAPTRSGAGPSRGAAASLAGLSIRQRKTALRVANIPAADFTAVVESDDPPTVTQLAEAGKKPKPILDVGDRKPEEIRLATQGQSRLELLANFAAETDPDIVIRGSFKGELGTLADQARIVIDWCKRLLMSLEEK